MLARDSRKVREDAVSATQAQTSRVHSFPAWLLKSPRGGILALVALVVTHGPSLWGQSHEVRDFLPHVLEDQKRIWSFPVKTSSWEKRQSWAMFGLAAASFSLDGRVSREVRNAPELHDFNRALASRPSDVVLAAFPAAVVGMGQLLQNERLTDYGWRSAEAAFDAFLVSAALKAATQRSRPHYDRTYGFWEGGNSFPSGHAAVAWSIAVVTAQRFKEHKWAAWVAYSAAGLVTFARVSSGNHFASDAIVGSLLGFGIGRYVAH